MKFAFIVQNLAQVSDSVGYDCIYQYRILRELHDDPASVRIFAQSYNSDLYTDVVIEPLSQFWTAIDQFPDAYIIYHFCDGWAKIDEFLREVARNAIVRWHNNTPPWFSVGSNVDFAADCNKGFEIISRFAHAGTVRFMVNSEFTRRQLHALGGRDSLIDTVFPASTFLLKDRSESPYSPPRSAQDQIDLLFVGRVVPHKGHRHILSVAAAVQRFLGRPVRVLFAGSLETRLQNYWSELSEIGIRLDVETVLLGLVSDAELARLYESCDAFICMSEHEGFGMPVFEAMRSHVPVIAWSTSALADLLVGHPFASSDFAIPRFAACVIAALEPSIRQRVIAFQQHTLAGYTDVSVRAQLLQALNRAAGCKSEGPVDSYHVNDASMDDVVTFVSDLAEWIEKEIGTSVEIFMHDASINYVSLYDIAVHNRLISYIQSGGQVAVGLGAGGRPDDLDELHPDHTVIRHIMAGGTTADLEGPRELGALLAFDDEVFVRMAYRAMLGREADAGGSTAYLRRVRNGEDKLAVLRELASSGEGRVHAGPLAKAALVAKATKDADHLQHAEMMVDRLQRFLVPTSGASTPYHPMRLMPHVDDLLRLNSLAFIDMSYRILTGHAADPGQMEQHLNDLRQGLPRRRFLSTLAETEAGKGRIDNLEGLSAYLSIGGNDAAVPLSTGLARLANNLGRLTNQLLLHDGKQGSSGVEESARSLLRLTEEAIRTTANPSMEHQHALAVENGAANQARSARPEGIDTVETTAGPGEIAIDQIHQILITYDGKIPEPLPEIVRHNVHSLRRLHPEANYRLWGIDDLRQFIVAHFEPEVVEGFDLLQAFALKADLGRYCLLYVYGGLYSDLSNRFLSRWRIPLGKTIACFREHRPLHGALWMNQNTMIYSAPAQPEIRLAIDLVLENIRNRDYGVSSLAPSGPILFGRVLAALGRANFYQIGEALNLQVEGSLNRANYINRDGTLVAARLQGSGGKLSEVGLHGTNVYGDMWDRREIYGEGLLLFRHDHPAVSSDEPSDFSGIHLVRGGKDRGLGISGIALPRGLYTVTVRFAVQEQSGVVRVAVHADGGWRRLGRHGGMRPDASGEVSVELALDGASQIDLDIRVGDAFHGVFKHLAIRRISHDPADRGALATVALDAHGQETRARVEAGVSHVHHIAYDPRFTTSDEEGVITENLRLAAALHDDARQMVWSEASLREFIASRFNPDAVWAYDCLPNFANRSELGRYCLLYAIGGLYVDPWLRIVNPIDVPRGKRLACFRTTDVEDGVSWSVDTSLLYAAPGQPEFEQLIDQIIQSVQAGEYGVVPAAVTGGERLGRGLAVSYDARRYFGGEVLPLTRGLDVVNDCFVSQDGRLIAVRRGPDNPIARMQWDARSAWNEGRIYAHLAETPQRGS